MERHANWVFWVFFATILFCIVNFCLISIIVNFLWLNQNASNAGTSVAVALPVDNVPVTYQIDQKSVGDQKLSHGQATPVSVATLTPTPTVTPVPPTPTHTVMPTETPSPTPLYTATVEPTVANIAAKNAPGMLPARLVIPALNLDVPIVDAPLQGESWQVDHLGQMVGHLEKTGNAGTPGNMVLAGHVTLPPDGEPGPFVSLRLLSPGDEITVYTNKQAFTYTMVNQKIVKPANVEVTFPTSNTQVTLLTCLNYDKTAGQYADRLVIVGELTKSN